MATIRKAKLSEFTQDPENANLGTERGLRALEDSLRQDGAADAGTIDRNGIILSGNKRAERFADLGLDEVLVVETDGHTPVFVQRTDVDANTPEGRRLAVALNRVHELDLAWDADALQALQGEGVDLSGLWNENEWDRLVGNIQTPDDPREEWEAQGMPEFEQGEDKPESTIIVQFRCETDRIEFLEKMGEKPDRRKSIWYPRREYEKQD